MNRFCGLMSIDSSVPPKEDNRRHIYSDMTYTSAARGSSSDFCVRATQQWSIHTTPTHHSVAAGYAYHASFGSLDADSITRVILGKGLGALRGAEGSYVAGQIDRNSDELTLFSDPLNSRPVFYQHINDRLAFASEAKLLAPACGTAWTLNKDEALQFLMNRFAVGYETLFADAVRLPPGHMLHFNPRSQKVRVERYWDLKFDSSISSNADAVDNLHRVFFESHQTMFDELRSKADSYRLYLTGGMDSRAILGYAQKLGCLPALAQTWGETDGIPDSDPVIAQQLADSVGVPYEFSTVTAENWVDHAAQWAWNGELQSDNANNYATPLNFFSGHDPNSFRFSVAGDQMLGAGPIPGSNEQAIDNILHSAKRMAVGPLSSLLNGHSAESMMCNFNDRVQYLVEQCPNSHPKDLQDYLYFHAYISRWILAPGNFKYPVVDVRRPLMTMDVIEISRHLAPELRVDKAAFIQLLKREFPHLLSVPKMANESGIDWAYHSRANSRLRSELIRLTRPEKLESLAIHDALDQEAVRSFLSEFFSENPAQATEGGRLRRGLYDIRRHVSRIPVLKGISSKVQPLVKKMVGIQREEDHRYRHEVVMRLALLALFEEQLHSQTSK